MDKSGNGIENWRELRQKFLTIPHVTGATPALFAIVFASAPAASGTLLSACFTSGADRYALSASRPSASPRIAPFMTLSTFTSST